MSIPATSIDPSRRLDLYFRVKRAGSKKFIFLDASGNPIDVSAYSLALYIKEYAGARTNVIALTVGSGLTIGGAGNNEATAAFTVANTNINEGEYFLELYKGSTSKTYLNGKAIAHNGLFDGVSNDTSSVIITDGADTVTVQITDAPASGSIPLVDFATELTFDQDSEMETVLGGTTTFTLAASGHVNGVGIIARINEPVAVNFPAGFEAISGSDSISTSHMNIIIFRYFSDYDGAGNAKVLYTVKNQTAV